MEKTLCASLILITLSAKGHAEEFYFDPNLFFGSAFGQNIDKFNQLENEPTIGEFLLDVYVNNILVKSREPVIFKENADHHNEIEPFVSADLIKAAQIIVLNDLYVGNNDAHLFLRETGQPVSWQFDQSLLRLNLTVPQQSLHGTPRGYIPVSQWDEGASALYIRHNTNFYRTENTANNHTYNYLWSSINSGMNLGLWQIRHQGNFRYSQSSITDSDYKYNVVRTWLQRPIPEIESMLTLGDSYTSSNLFGSLSFRGVKLATDVRMKPQSLRGYAPEVRGIASSTARVVVRQSGKIIYETNVAPGAFVIDDLYNTPSQGDLHIEVIEADGQISTFTVPYASVPDSVRPGSWNYELALGKVRNYSSVDNEFVEGILQYGVNNYLTVNTGTRLAKDYNSWLVGGVVASSMGAFGVNTVYSNAELENGKNEHGWRVEANYSKSFDTGTNVVLAAYRYSSSGYRDLQDVLGVRRQSRNGMTFYSDSLNQRHRFSATIGQSMNEYGQLNLTASTADYYSDSSRNTQLQLGYNNTWNQVSFNLSVARQKIVQNAERFYTSVNDRDYDNSNRYSRTENMIFLGVSIPFNWGSHRSSVSFNMNRNKDTRSGTIGLTGSAGEESNFTYSLYSGVERARYDNSNSVTWGGTVQQNTSVGSFRGSFAHANHYRQFGLGTSGTMILHQDGLTIGPYVSETFALVKAKGASGAVVRNGQGATIDRFGYAILPSISPYRYNNISLETRGMNDQVELQGGSKQVVPYAGAIPRVEFETIFGQAVLINTVLYDGSTPPMGSDVVDDNGELVGIVGQAGQVYARLDKLTGNLQITWGTKEDQTCKVSYKLPTKSDSTFVLLDSVCVQD